MSSSPRFCTMRISCFYSQTLIFSLLDWMSQLCVVNIPMSANSYCMHFVSTFGGFFFFFYRQPCLTFALRQVWKQRTYHSIFEGSFTVIYFYLIILKWEEIACVPYCLRVQESGFLYVTSTFGRRLKFHEWMVTCIVLLEFWNHSNRFPTLFF